MNYLKKLFLFLKTPIGIVLVLSVATSIISTGFFYLHGNVTSYGDSESHLNISKRIIDSPTSGFAQLGGIWLPIPHLLMLPFTYSDFLWRSGLAGSIISGIAFVVSSIFIYKSIYFLTKNKLAGFIGFIIFALNTNILYMQSTPMTELTLIAFFILSTFYFIRYLYDTEDNLSLIFAAFFAFCASLTRYDGWFLVGIEGLIISMKFLFSKFDKKYFGQLFLYGSLAVFGIIIWVVWDYLILGDPLYFTNSPFSAKSQQQGWLARGELITYHNLVQSFLHYTVTSLRNIGPIISIGALLSILFFIINKKIKNKFYILILLSTPFIFYVVTLFMGQSVIFIPDLTPKNFEWNLFNVRYGIMMVPFAAILIGYLFANKLLSLKLFVLLLIFTHSIIYFSGRLKPITLVDGTEGLSASKSTDAEKFISKNYKDGFVLLDDYARSVSILRSNLPMEKVIYVGNRKYWDESLKTPEKYATWIVLQKDDQLWKNIYENKERQGRLFKYFNKVYTSNEILIFKKNDQISKNL